MQNTWAQAIQFPKIKNSALCLFYPFYHCDYCKYVLDPSSALLENTLHFRSLGLAFKVFTHVWSSKTETSNNDDIRHAQGALNTTNEKFYPQTRVFSQQIMKKCGVHWRQRPRGILTILNIEDHSNLILLSIQQSLKLTNSIKIMVF